MLASRTASERLFGALLARLVSAGSTQIRIVKPGCSSGGGAYLPAMAAESATNKPCAICGKPQEQRLRPFCSRRCADVDLNRWLSGVYAVPAVEATEDGGEFEPDGRKTIGNGN